MQVQYSRTGSANRRAGSRYWRSKSAYLGVIPFFLFTDLFIFYPTLIVVIGAFRDQQNKFSTEILFGLLKSDRARQTFYNSLEISMITAIAGAILGALFAWALVTGKPGGIFYRISVALSSVLAQFGGVMLAFAFLATFGFNGLVSTLALKVLPNYFIEPSRVC